MSIDRAVAADYRAGKSLDELVAQVGYDKDLILAILKQEKVVLRPEDQPKTVKLPKPKDGK